MIVHDSYQANMFYFSHIWWFLTGIRRQPRVCGDPCIASVSLILISCPGDLNISLPGSVKRMLISGHWAARGSRTASSHRQAI